MKREVISLTPYYNFHPLHRHLDISRAITEESLPLHIGSCRAQTGLAFAWFFWQFQSGVAHESVTYKKACICLYESQLKMMKNVFYFILKALFVLKILKFLSRLFAHVEKTALLER